ncbi:MAG: HAMP domain-containing sensor histidine kinase [Proteobacteria bacterium]|nr:HAMP domain-containing sensor histidine kinase [Pseudomonadota bacterium]
MKSIFNDPKNLRYSLNTIIPFVVFLTSILSAMVGYVSAKHFSGSYFIFIYVVSLFSTLCSFLIISAITQPVINLVKKVEHIVRFGEFRKEKGQMMEVYTLIEKLTELAKQKDFGGEKTHSDIKKDIERLDYIVPLGYMSLMVAHEVRNPLNTITGMSELLRENLIGKQATTYIDAILDSARKIDAFTKELLDFTDDSIEHEEFDINLIVKESLNTLRGQFNHIKCDFVTDSESIIFRGDRTRIFQAVYNLLKNAFQHEVEGGYVRIEIKNNNILTILVYNKSSIIKTEDIEAIFKPFFSKRKGGRGLGLFISIRNIRMHGGDINVETGDEGTKFTITLPGFK